MEDREIVPEEPFPHFRFFCFMNYQSGNGRIVSESENFGRAVIDAVWRRGPAEETL